MGVWGSPKTGAEDPLNRLNRASEMAPAVVDAEQARSHLGLHGEDERRGAAEALPAESDRPPQDDDGEPRVPLLRAPVDGWARTEELARAIVKLGDLRRDFRATPADLIAQRILEALDAEFRQVGRCLADQMGPQPVADTVSAERDRALGRITWILAAFDKPGGLPSPSLAGVIRALDPAAVPVPAEG